MPTVTLMAKMPTEDADAPGSRAQASPRSPCPATVYSAPTISFFSLKLTAQNHENYCWVYCDGTKKNFSKTWRSLPTKFKSAGSTQQIPTERWPPVQLRLAGAQEPAPPCQKTAQPLRVCSTPLVTCPRPSGGACPPEATSDI